MHLLSRTLAVVAFVVAGVLSVGALLAHAQATSSAQRTVGAPRSTASAAPAATAPPLPLGDQSTLGVMRSTSPSAKADPLTTMVRYIQTGKTRSTRLIPVSVRRPPIPKLTDLLHHKARWRQSASGGSIVLTGTSSVPYLDDQTLAYGAQVFWICQNLTAGKNYRYIVFPPDGTAFRVQTVDYANGNANLDWFLADPTGRCMDKTGGGGDAPFYANLYLSTPAATSNGNANNVDNIIGVGPTRAGASDPAYSGVWAIAVQNQSTNNYDAVAYTVVEGTLNFATYSNAGMTTKSNDFASGSTVYVSASGLNPAHFYAFGFVNTGSNGTPCVGSVPTGSQNWNAGGTCFVSGASGILPTAGTVTGQFQTPATGANSAGTYSAQLYDTTTNDLISTQQFSVNPSSLTWTPLVPYNGTTAGTNLNDTFATDGLIGTPGGGPTTDQSVNAIQYQVSGLTNGDVYRITVSNANGVVMSGTTTDTNPIFNAKPQAFSLPYSFTAAGTTSGAQKVFFPLNVGNFTAFGATQTPFAPNVYTAQIYDVTSGATLGSKSFTILSYASTFQWTLPAGSYVNTAAANVATNVTTTIRNTGGTLYASWNGDSIKQVIINNDSGNFVTLGLQGGVTTATDSSGQTWNLVKVSNAQVTATPAVAGQSLPPNGTLAIPITVASATGACTTACVLRTQIVPLHGILPSVINATMLNTATNGLDVYSFGVVGTNTQATYSITAGTYTGPTSVLKAPRYNQAMYRQGTNGAPVSGVNPPTSYYPLTITVVNNGPRTLYAIELTLPPTVDPNALTPNIQSATINGASQTGNYRIYTQNGTNGAGGDTNLGPNSFAIVARSTGAGVGLATGKTGTYVINFPIMLSSFPFQEIAATANYCGTTCAVIGNIGAPFQMSPTNSLTNAVAGTSNIDSTELGVFSLDTRLMSAVITPAVVASLPNQNWTFKFTNTSTGLDPNPDYISQLLITVPPAGAGIYPTITSVVGSNGATWNANPTGTQGQWLIDLCAVAVAPVGGTTQSYTACAGNTDTNSLPPGGTLTVNFNYAAAPAVSTPPGYPINWTVVGANGGGVVAASGTDIPDLVVANTTAQTSFTYAGGYTATPSYPPGAPISPVTFGTQPTIGSWANYNNGNAYVFELNNNGSTTITNVSLAIPWANTSGQLLDTANPWNVIAGSINIYGAGVGAGGSKCLGNAYASLTQAVNGAPGTSGLLTLSGCNLQVGQKLDIFFNAKEPYDIGSTFRFDAAVATGNVTAPDPRTNGNANTLAIYSLSNTVRVIADARLTIVIPTGGAWPGGTFFGQGTLSASSYSCGGCTFTNTLTPIINLNNISGTATIKDTLGASVYSDDSAGWALSVQADINPSTSSGQVSTFMLGPGGHSSTPTTGSFTASLPTGAPGTVIPTAGNLAVSNWTGGSSTYHFPIDNLMSYQVTVNPLSVNNNNTTTITLTYTLIAN
jgi:hypothetical protein